MREPHLDALALATRLLEGIGAGERSGDITSALIDVARDPALRCFWTASGFEIALCTVQHTAAIEDGISDIDPSGSRQCFAGRATISVGAFVVAEVLLEKVPSSRSDLSQTGMCGAIRFTSTSQFSIGAAP